MAKPRLNGSTIKLMDPDVKTAYQMDDEGNETNKKYNPMADAMFDPLFNKFTYDEIKDGAKFIGKDNITNDNQVADIVSYLNNRAGSSNNKSNNSAFEDRQALQEENKERRERRARLADREAKEAIVTFDEDPDLQELVARQEKDRNDLASGEFRTMFDPPSEDDSPFQQDAANTLLGNYIKQLLA